MTGVKQVCLTHDPQPMAMVSNVASAKIKADRELYCIHLDYKGETQ